MAKNQSTVGMESVVELFWNAEEITAGALSDSNPACPGVDGSRPPEPVIRPQPPPPLPFWTIRYVIPFVSCGN